MLGAPLDPGMAWGASKSAIRTGRWAASWTFIHPYAIAMILYAVSVFSAGSLVMGAVVGESYQKSKTERCEQVPGGGVVPQCILVDGSGGMVNIITTYNNKRPKSAMGGLSAWSFYGATAFFSAALVVTFLSLFDEPAFRATPQGWQATRGHVSMGSRKRNLYVGSRRVWQSAKRDQAQARRRVEKIGSTVEAVKRWKLRHHPAPPEVAGQSRKTQREDRKKMREQAQSEAHRIATAMRVDAGGPADQVAAWRHVVGSAHEPVGLPKAPPKMAAAFPSNPGPPPPLPTDEAVS